MSTQKKMNDQLENMSLSQLIEQLDNIVSWFDGADFDIDQASQQFDKGAKLVELIKAKLAQNDNKIKEIKLRLQDIESKD